ncbi:MAG TPA: hypothetical protein PLD02_11045 [Saprospiraceae bacterium]|nr:hypothetical protein [Saprospiraceae bacterium]
MLLSIVFFAPQRYNAQQANNWYFGLNAGISFTSNPPTILTNGQTNIPDNTSAISDQNGNLLFYTDGKTVWNGAHVPMANGTGLIGHSSAGQCALIVPIPCHPNKYAIFHVTEFASPGDLHYSVVDMSLNGGLGGVVAGQKNISLGTGWTEKLCAYYNPSGNNYWVLAHKWNNNQFVAFNVNSISIATSSVVTSIGSIHNCGSYGGVHDAMGQLTISPDGTKVVNALTCQDKFEFFDFNSTTGVLSNSISITGNGWNSWGTAFSPDSKKVYTNDIFGQNIFQYDINTYAQAAILASKISIAAVPAVGYNFGYMELGPNGKLYIAKPNANFLSVVNNPNNLGAACNFSLSGQSLGIKVSSHGISRIAYNIPNGPGMNAIAVNSATTCSGNSVTLTAQGAPTYTWSNNLTGSVIVVSPTVNTTYTVSGLGFCSAISSVAVLPNPTLSILGNSLLCAGSVASLSVNGANTYTWSNLVTGSVINVSPNNTSTYSAIGTNTATGCVSNANYTLQVIPLPTVSIIGSSLICSGQVANLTANGANSYLWSNFSPGSIIQVSPISTSVFSVVGTSALGGCQGSAQYTVNVVPVPAVIIAGSSLICSGQVANLTASGANNYLWSNLSPGSVIQVSPTSTSVYSVVGTSSIGGCQATAAHTINVVHLNELDRGFPV